MRILVTGAKGMLGSDICRVMRERHEVIGTDIEDLDITDTALTLARIREARPQAIIHCAAFTNVDAAEMDPDTAYRVNALGTWNVASAAAQAGSTLFYISTDYIFDGEKGDAYTEWDTPTPLSHYGSSKLAGERAIGWVGARAFIIRSSWLFGECGKCFPKVILSSARNQSELRVVADQVGCPTYTVDLARAIEGLLDSPLPGIYHITNSGRCSWYQYALKILELAGITDVEVRPITSREWPTPTRRPQYSVLRHYALELQGRDTLRPWDEALAEFIRGMV